MTISFVETPYYDLEMFNNKNMSVKKVSNVRAFTCTVQNWPLIFSGLSQFIYRYNKPNRILVSLTLIQNVCK